MFKAIRLIPDSPNINFLKIRYPMMMISGILVLTSLVLCFKPGLNFGIDFKGGILIEARFKDTPNIPDLRKELNGLGIGDITLQQVGTDVSDVMLRIPQPATGDSGNQTDIQTVRGHFGDRVAEYRRIEAVGPQVGGELVKTSIYAVLMSIGGTLAYLWFRFDRGFSIAAIVCLVHDVMMTLGFFAVTQLDFDLSTVAAVLLISGYSLNDTVVVFDRIREDQRKYKSKSLLETAHIAINETLFRTMMTSCTTLLVLISLFIFGGAVIRSFTSALLFGIVIGTYSSIYIATPIWMMIDRKREA